MPVLLELCCGWKSVSNEFRTGGGWTVVTLDVLPKFRPDILADVCAWDFRKYFEDGAMPIPDVIWASPPCKTFTVAAWGKHRDGGGGATTAASREGDACVRACLGCIDYCLARNPNLLYFVENPLYGAFRKLECVQPFLRAGQFRRLQYGDYAPDTHSLKPTLVLTNCLCWQPKPMVLTKSKRHWNKLSKKQRTIIPQSVCREVLASCCRHGRFEEVLSATAAEARICAAGGPPAR